jgi:hypothetical protein
MARKPIPGGTKPKVEVAARIRVTGTGGAASLARSRARSERKDSCWKLLRSESRARAEKVQSSGGALFTLDGELRCECGAHVGARESQSGGPLLPTFHYPHKPARPLAPAKVFRVKR